MKKQTERLYTIIVTLAYNTKAKSLEEASEEALANLQDRNIHLFEVIKTDGAVCEGSE